MTAITAQQDLQDRWLPTPQAVRHALALLKAEPAADMAVIPMYQPGKTYGIWETGQEVRTVPGVVFIAVNSFVSDGHIPSYSWARDAASDMGKGFLDSEGGTAGWAVVHRDGHTAVFEEIL